MTHGRDPFTGDRADRATTAAAGLLALALTLLVGAVAWARQGNLAWDDADYLRRALHIADRASGHGATGVVPGLVRGVLKEQPKPPLLVAWIACGRLALGKPGDLRPLIVFATAVPFGLLALATARVARRLAGGGAAVVAVAALAASPLALAFGAKVMVETFMGLWVLLSLDAAVRLLERPTTRRAAALGLALGAATMTKLTVALLLPLPLAGLGVLYVRRHPLDRRAASLALTVAAAAAVVAGPWYTRHAREAVDFAVFSSRYNHAAEGRSDEVPAATRLAALAGDLAGWPAAGAAVVGLLAVGIPGVRRGDTEPSAPPARDFGLLAVLGAFGGAVVLLRTSYFDPRFLLPIWASLAVTAGILPSRVTWTQAALRRSATVLAAGLLVGGVGVSVGHLLHEPTTRTFWGTRALIDELVGRYRVATIGNLGNCAEWNVCKSGLLNELRARPGDCFVLFDVSQWSPQDVDRRLDRLDAVVVLDEQALGREIRAGAPGLNRAYSEVESRLSRAGQFERVAVDARADLPPLDVYVRRR